MLRVQESRWETFLPSRLSGRQFDIYIFLGTLNQIHRRFHTPNHRLLFLPYQPHLHLGLLAKTLVLIISISTIFHLLPSIELEHVLPTNLPPTIPPIQMQVRASSAARCFICDTWIQLSVCCPVKYSGCDAKRRGGLGIGGFVFTGGDRG